MGQDRPVAHQEWDCIQWDRTDKWYTWNGTVYNGSGQTSGTPGMGLYTMGQDRPVAHQEWDCIKLVRKDAVPQDTKG